MFKLSKLRSIIDNLINAIAISVLIFVSILSLYGILDIHQAENSGAISDEVKALAPDDTSDNSHSFDELKKINPEIIAWLTIDDTSIDYPVVQANNNSKYLTHDYKGQYAINGAAFLDYQNNQLKDDYSIIYAHRSSNHIMFSDIVLYKERKYFDAHQTGALYTPDGDYDLAVVGFAVIDATSNQFYNLTAMRNGKNGNIHSVMKEKASHLTEGGYRGGKLLLLSTCDKDSRHYRDVLLLEMRPRQ